MKTSEVYEAFRGPNTPTRYGIGPVEWARFVDRQFSRWDGQRSAEVRDSPGFHRLMHAFVDVAGTIYGPANLRDVARAAGHYDTEYAVAKMGQETHNRVRSGRGTTPVENVIHAVVQRHGPDLVRHPLTDPDPVGADGTDWLGWWEKDTDEGRAVRARLLARRNGTLTVAEWFAYRCPYLTAEEGRLWALAPADVDVGISATCNRWRYAGVSAEPWLWVGAGYSLDEAAALLSPDNPDPAPSNDELVALAAMRGVRFPGRVRHATT